MKIRIISALILMFCYYPLMASEVVFYDDTISFKNAPLLYEGQFNKGKLKQYRSDISITSFAREIEDYKKKLLLNDYYVYKLIMAFSEQQLKANQRQKAVLVYSVLYEMGYLTRIGYYGLEYFVFVRSEQEMFGLYTVEINGEKYYDVFPKNHHSHNYTLIEDNIVKKGMMFDFSFKKIPNLKNYEYLNHNIRFKHLSDSIEITVLLNKTLIKILNDCPQLCDFCYFNMPLSNSAYFSLIPLLRKSTEDKSLEEGIRYILSFCRTFAIWEDDRKVYGKEKPMFVEEVLYYRYSDCEDRSVLFYYIIKELYNLPMVILKYPNHINVAVHLEDVEKYEHRVKYKGKYYVVCEPTNSTNNLDIGKSNFFEKYPNPTIIGYIP